LDLDLKQPEVLFDAVIVGVDEKIRDWQEPVRGMKNPTSHAETAPTLLPSFA
jgi:tRNA(Arg) A34 adenosine deaminase TadA